MDIDNIISDEKIFKDVYSIFESCNWEIEINSIVHQIPKDTNLEIQTKAYIKANAPDVFIGSHLEVVIIVGCEKGKNNWSAKYGFLKLYYDLKGNFVSEDRFDKFGS